MKKIPLNIVHSFINFVKTSDFYNKIQITFQYTGGAFNTETFYFFEDKWGHSIFREEDGKSEVIQDTKIIEDENILIERLGSLETDAKVIIASNSSEYILTLKI